MGARGRRGEFAPSLPLAVAPSPLAVSLRRSSVVLLVAAVAAGAVSLARWQQQAPGRRHFQAGLAAAEAGRPREAEREWRAAIRTAPDYLPPYRLLSGLYLSTGLWRKGYEALEQLQTAAPREPHLGCQLAEALYHLERLPEAESQARRDLEEDAACGRAHLILGQLMIRRKNEREAVTHLRAAARRLPGEIDPQIYLAQAYLENMRLSEAEALLVPLLVNHPNLAHAHYMLGFCYARNAVAPDSARKAETHLRRALELNPNDEGAACELGRLYVLTGRAAEAVPLLQQAARLAPGYLPTYYHLSRALRARHQEREARQAEAHYRELNRLAMEESELIERYGLAPDDPEILLRLARLKQAQGEPEAAQAYLERAHSAHPEPTRARAATRRLGTR